MSADNSITLECKVYNSLLEELAQLRKIVAGLEDKSHFQDWNCLLEGIISATSCLLSTNDFDSSVNAALVKLGNVFGVDRIYIVECPSSLTTAELSVSQGLWWYNNNIPAGITPAYCCCQDLFGLWYEKLLKGNLIYGSTRSFSEAEQKLLETQHILSLLVIPIVVENRFWGFIGFDNFCMEQEFSQPEISLLRVFADNLAGAISRHEAMLHLQESQQRLQLVINNLPMSVYWKDYNCVYQGCNRDGAKIAGLNSSQEIIGKTEYDMPWGKEKGKLYSESDLRVIEFGLSELNIIETLHNYDSQSVWVNSSRIPLQDDAGNTVGILVTFEYVTQLKEARNYLYTSPSDVRTLFDSVYDAIFIRDLNGKILDVNQKMLQMYGVSLEDATKLSFLDDYSSLDDGLNWVQEIWQDAIAGKNQLFEWKAKKPLSGEVFDVEVFLCKIHLNSQDVILTSVREITQRKQAEAKLQQLNEELETKFEVRTLQLIQSESRLRNLTNSTPGIIYEFCKSSDGTMKLLYVSSGCEDILGLAAQALLEDIELFFATIHPEDLPGFYDSIILSAESLEIWEYEWRSTTPDFQQKWLRGMSRPLRQNNNDITWYGYLFDISHFKAIESKLQHSQQLLQLVMDNIPQSIFWKDCNNVYLGCNLKFATDAGLNYPKNIIGKTDYELRWSPEFAQLYRKSDRAIMDNDIPQLHSINFHEEANGKKLWFDTSKIPLHDIQGNVVGLLGCIEDISDRKEIEACLQQSETKFRSIVETANDIIYILSPDKNISYISPNWKDILGHESNEVIGKPFAVFIHSDDLTIFLDAFSDLLTKERVNGLEHRVIHKNQTHRWYTSNLAAVKDEDGTILYFTAIARDVTERREAEILLKQQKQQLEETLQQLQLTQAQLIQSEKMSSLGQMVAGVAHEINNPVSFIYSNLLPTEEYIQDLFELIELYQQHYPHPVKEIEEKIEKVELDFLKEDLTKILDSMEVGTERIREIVLSLRNFSRLDESDFKRVDIHEGIDSTLLILHNTLKGKNKSPEIEVIKDYGSLPLVDCHAGELNQVFMNILTNAIDALSDDYQNNSPQIYISTTINANNWVQIAIADNGMGIPEKIQSKLFDPFFTTKKVGKGTGLGLSISYQIVVDQHGGKLYCQSTQNQGTRFVLEIPVRQNN
ncbi:MAG: PAS domain S-box protein [Cyanobacteria bacterium P01_A01_bin.84]